MLSSSVVFISVVFVIPTVSLTPDCRVTSSSTLTVKHGHLTTTTFWGFINIVEERSFLSLRFYENGLPLLCIEYNHTHVTIREIMRLDSTGRTSEPVTWPVCSQWRQFHLVVHHNFLVITDDHNITWVSRNIHQSATHLELVMHHLKPSCTTPTPVWEVGANTQDIVAPRCQDALYFTFQANNTVTPQLTVGNVSLSLHQLSQSQPRLSLTVRGNPGATARVVGLLSPPHMVAVVWAMTVEVDCTLPTVSVSSENGGTFILTQYIHLQECPPKTEKAQQGDGLQDCAQVYRLSLILALVLVILMFTLCVSCFLHLKTKQNRLRREQTPRTQRKGMEKQYKVTQSAAYAQRESALYLDPRPAPSGLLHPTHIALQPWAPSTHIYENSENSSTDNYDEFESDIYNA